MPTNLNADRLAQPRELDKLRHEPYIQAIPKVYIYIQQLPGGACSYKSHQSSPIHLELANLKPAKPEFADTNNVERLGYRQKERCFTIFPKIS